MGDVLFLTFSLGGKVGGSARVWSVGCRLAAGDPVSNLREPAARGWERGSKPRHGDPTAAVAPAGPKPRGNGRQPAVEKCRGSAKRPADGKRREATALSSTESWGAAFGRPPTLAQTDGLTLGRRYPLCCVSPLQAQRTGGAAAGGRPAHTRTGLGSGGGARLEPRAFRKASPPTPLSLFKQWLCSFFFVYI